MAKLYLVSRNCWGRSLTWTWRGARKNRLAQYNCFFRVLTSVFFVSWYVCVTRASLTNLTGPCTRAEMNSSVNCEMTQPGTSKTSKGMESRP